MMGLADALETLTDSLQEVPGFVGASEDVRGGEVIIVAYFARGITPRPEVPTRHGGFRVVMETVDGVELHTNSTP